jgi:hypothetical protein
MHLDPYINRSLVVKLKMLLDVGACMVPQTKAKKAVDVDRRRSCHGIS